MADALREAAQQALVALVHHTDQTRPIQRTADAIAALRAALSAPAPAPAEAALKQARWEGIQSVQIQTAEIVRAALELLDAAGDTFPPERLAAFQRVFGAAPAAPAVPQWQPIETAPAEGQFLVYTPAERRNKIQTATWHPKVKIIGNVFAFDSAPPTHWMPLPAAPSAPGAEVKP